MKTKNGQAGVSLVEMLVSSAVSTVIGGVIYTVFFMYNNQAGASVSTLLMQQQYDNVSNQIARDIRRASWVLGPGESPTSFPAGEMTVNEIVLCDASGAVIAQYAISGTNLTEGSQRTPFKTGGGALNCVPGASNFVLDPQRRSVSINLSLYKDVQRTTHSIAARKDVFQCRNRM